MTVKRVITVRAITVTINVIKVNETPTTLPTISVSSNPPLTEETLHESVITLEPHRWHF